MFIVIKKHHPEKKLSNHIGKNQHKKKFSKKYLSVIKEYKQKIIYLLVRISIR
jgi:hypothetical protein